MGGASTWGGRHRVQTHGDSGRVRRGDGRGQGCTYAGPGFLVCSFLLSRLGLLSSSVFLQGLFSFTLICLEGKFQGVFL